MDAHGNPVRVLVTAGATADCTQAGPLLEGLTAEHLLADRGYDTNAILEQAAHQGMTPVIPPRKHRLVQRDYDRYLYKQRHLVENAVLRLKGWRGIATRYAKRALVLLGHRPDSLPVLWANIS